MSKKSRCYISYCQKDIRTEDMGVVVKWLLKLCNYQIDFLFDGDVKFSESFDGFEGEIFNVDAILIFFSPKYKERCIDEDNTGVSSEYRKILSVLEMNRKLQQQDYDKYIKQRKTIYTVLYKGKKDLSITLASKRYH